MTTPDLNTLLPTIKSVTINADSENAEVIKITPFRFGQFQEVIKHISTLKASMSADGDVDIMKLIAEHGNEVGDVIALATKKTIAQVNDLSLDEICELALAIVEVNRDFFSQRLTPKLREMGARLTAKK